VSWTAAYPSFWPHPNASYNLAQDLHAARVLFDCGVPLVYLPGYYVGEELRVSLPEIEAHVAGSGPVGCDLAALYRAWGADARLPGSSKVLWDLINVAWIVEPAWLATELVPAPRSSQPSTAEPPPVRQFQHPRPDAPRVHGDEPQSTATFNAWHTWRMRSSLRRPMRSTSVATETFSIESRLTALRCPIGSSPGSRTTSLASPRTVVVHGPMRQRRIRGIAASLESTTTGRRPR